MRVLLITDTERVLRVFEAMETKGLLQLRTVATLAQGEQEISASAPEVTFIQGRISGVCAEIELRHLRKVLPKGAKAVLLAGEAIDQAQAKKDGRPCIELSLEDEDLEEAVIAALTGVRRPAPKKGSAGQDSPAKGRAKSKEASTVPPEPAEQAGDEDVAPSEEFITEPSPEVADGPEAEEPPFEVALRETGTTEAESFAEVMRRGTAKIEAAGGDRLEVEDRVDIGSRFSLPVGESATPLRAYLEPEVPLSLDDYLHGEPLADAMRRAEEKKRPSWLIPLVLAFILIPLVSFLAGKKKALAPTPVNLAATSASRQLKRPGKVLAPSSAKSPLSKTTTVPSPSQSSALSTALTAALSTVPVIAPGMTAPAVRPSPPPAAHPVAVAATKPEATPVAKTAPPQVAKPTPTPTPKPAVKPVAKPEVKPTPKPEVKPAVRPEAKPVAKAPVAKPEVKQAATPAAKAAPAAVATLQPNAPPVPPAAKGGVKTLPQFMTSAKLDAAYGKSHPGWQRYTDSTAEYKTFKEDNLYKAVQVVAQGKESVPIALFRKLLLEFGGINRFRVESTEKSGDYLLERGVGAGGVAVTIYRKKNDHRMKGVVLYYR